MAKQYLEAVKYLRLSYIYAKDVQLKEHALYYRAEVYTELGFVYEARADYLVFIRDFPSSKLIKSVHLGLAESLYKIGRLRQAIKHFKEAGKKTAALFGTANALQKLERIEEAKQIYDQAMLLDKSYVKNSPETNYLYAENMRMSGDITHAKKELTLIDFGPFKDHASISMGLIAMKEGDTEEAVKKFKSAAQSRDQKVKVRALFNLSLAYMKEGKFKEAASSLEDIRHNHIDSFMYKDTLLVLSKLYNKEGKTKESVALLKELVYGKQPPRDAFGELEKIIMKTSENSKSNDAALVTLWNEVGQWLVDERREDFLLDIAEKLRHKGKPYLDLCTWLVENGTQRARGKAAINLADYYISIGNIKTSEKYAGIAHVSKERGDAVSRVEAKILRATGNFTGALKKIMDIEEIDKGDLDLLGYIIMDINEPASIEVQEAVAFYEDILNQSEWDAANYVDLADIYYSMNNRRKSLEYYRIAHKKDPDNEWAAYRLATGTGSPESGDVLSRLQQEDDLLGRLAKSKLKEMALMDKIREVY